MAFRSRCRSLRCDAAHLSAAIRELETELDVLIVERGQRFRSLTTEGERVVEWW
jgi:DNA-binding transcriptional LysR family regulator